MRSNWSLSVFTSLAFVIAGLLSPLHAQTSPASQPDSLDDNPPVANCNTTPDTDQAANPAQVSATPITDDLLTSGQPCTQTSSTKGLIPASDFGAGLPNRQRGFDFYSWLTFIAMNSPAAGKRIGKGPGPAATR